MSKYSKEWKWEHLFKQERMTPFPERIQKVLAKVDLSDSKAFSEGLYLFGPTGVGKTFKACQIALEAMKWDFMQGKITTCGFYNVPNLLLRIRNTFDKNSVESEMAIYRELKDVPYLILDDLGVEKNSEWSFQTLYVIISYRYDNMLPIIITSNYSLEELAIKMGQERITSRIRQMCRIERVESIDLRR